MRRRLSLAPFLALEGPFALGRFALLIGARLRKIAMSTNSKTSDTAAAETKSAAEETAVTETARDTTEEQAVHDRQFRAEMIVKEHMIASLGLGLIPFPLVDIATGVASNVTLVSRLCALYDQPFKASLARTAILTIMGTVGSIGAAVTVGFSLAKFVPGIGTAAGTVTLPIANASTAYMIGKMFIGHFEMGGTLFDFDPRSNVPQARSAYAKGRAIASDLLASRKKASDDTAAASAEAAAATA